MTAAWQWLAGNPLVMTLLVMMAADVAMGVCLAWGAGTLSSTFSHRGFMRKSGTLIVVGIAYLLQRHMPDFPSGHITCTAFIATEGISILENAALLGIPVPSSLVRSLEKMHEPDTPKRNARRSVEIKTNRVVVRGRDTHGEMDIIRDDDQ